MRTLSKLRADELESARAASAAQSKPGPTDRATSITLTAREEAMLDHASIRAFAAALALALPAAISGAQAAEVYPDLSGGWSLWVGIN